MRTKHELLSPAKCLMMQWQALWAMAFAFGKAMTLAQKFDPRAAAENAEMLEVWSRFAVFTLIGQVAAIEANGAAETKEDTRALAHCRAIIGALAALCLLAAKVKRRCLQQLGIFAALGTVGRSAIPCADTNALAEPDYRDSS